MTEIELKFQIPDDRRAAVARAMATAQARTQTLRAIYFDTPDRRLAGARMALRLRREDGRWLQTLKAETPRLHERLEHQVLVPGRASAVPALVPARHAATPAGAALDEALQGATSELRAIHETRIRRTERRVRQGRSIVAVTLDVGELRAAGRTLAVHELEFELVSGRVQDLFDLCRRWVQRFGLWLDVRSKAERGDRLARGASSGSPRRAAPSPVTPQMAPGQALRVLVGEALAHALPNAADLADGLGTPEQLHQLRVALRRLRAVLRSFGAWSADVSPAWPAALRELFAGLGAMRDRDVLQATILPALQAAGAPSVALPLASRSSSPAAGLRAPTTTLLWLDLLRFAAAADSVPNPPSGGSDAPPGPAATDLRTLARPIVRRLHRRMRKDAKAFAGLAELERHEVRKRLKHLRYTTEFLHPLFESKALRRFLDRLAKALEAFGALQDAAVAEAMFREAAAQDPQAWFAVGWLVARKEALSATAGRQLKRLARLDPY